MSKPDACLPAMIIATLCTPGPDMSASSNSSHPLADNATSAAPLEALPLFDRIRATLLEDHGPVGLDMAGDVTSRALVPPERICKGYIQAKADGVLCGVNLLPLIFEQAEELVCAQAQNRAADLAEAEEKARAGKMAWPEFETLAQSARDAAFKVKILRKDGDKVTKGDRVAELEGGAQVMLFGERTALNLICHLSGISTQTSRFVLAVAGTKARIVDTRKTLPLWRDLEKYAVKCGGGENHRRGLYDMVLIKDNHLALWGNDDPAGAVSAAKSRFPKLPVMVEIVDLPGLARVCRAGAPEYVLLDNFTPARMKEAVQWCEEFYKTRPGRPLLEASGGITLETVRAFAETGVDRISVGALTHSVRALDLSLEILPGTPWEMKL